MPTPQQIAQSYDVTVQQRLMEARADSTVSFTIGERVESYALADVVTFSVAADHVTAVYDDEADQRHVEVIRYSDIDFLEIVTPPAPRE